MRAKTIRDLVANRFFVRINKRDNARPGSAQSNA
jgi:hypothetical protein